MEVNHHQCIQLMPASKPLATIMKGGKKRTFHASMEIVRWNNTRQYVTLGDFCAFATTDRNGDMGHSMQPWRDEPWGVGQILTLQRCLHIQSEKGVPGPPPYHEATVRWFPHVKSQFVERNLSKSQQTDLARQFRSKYLLLESSVIDTVKLEDCLLPGLIQLQDVAYFTSTRNVRGGEVPPDMVLPGCYHIYYMCTGQLLDGNYLKNKTATMHDYLPNQSMQQPPTSLARGWKLLQERNIIHQSQHQWLLDGYNDVLKMSTQSRFSTNGEKNVIVNNNAVDSDERKENEKENIPQPIKDSVQKFQKDESALLVTTSVVQSTDKKRKRNPWIQATQTKKTCNRGGS